MNILYKNTKLEHRANEINTKYVFISTAKAEAIANDYSVVVAKAENFENVVKLQVESGRIAIVCITAETYAELIELARACKAGVLFVSESAPSESVCLASLAGYSNYELDKFAAEIGAQIEIKRFVMSVAREVPFSLSRADAQKIIGEAAGHESESALELLDKVLDNAIIGFQRLKKVAMSDQIVTSKLSATRPGSEATAELLACANRIYDEGGVHVLEAGLGFGKTQHAIRPILLKAKADGKKTTLLTHRVSISGSFDDICAQYSDTKIIGNEDKLESLALVVNSANQQRFQVHTEQSDVLIIDEGSQVIAHILQKGFKGNRRGVFHELVKLIKSARLVLIADAFISDILVKFLALAGREINFMRGRVDNSQNEIALSEIATAQRMIIENIATSLKPMIGLDSKKEAEAMASYIEKRGKRVLLVTQTTRRYPAVVAFFKNPNTEMKKYDALVYSPSMQSSISIVEKHFDTHYCLFFGVIGVDDAKQFTRRDRTNRKVVVGVSRQVRQQLDKADLIDEFFASDDYVFDSIALSFYKVDAREKNNFRTNLAISFESDGYKVTRVKPIAADEIAAMTFNGEKRAVKEYVVKETMKAAQVIVRAADFDEFIEPESEVQRFHNDALKASRALNKQVSQLDDDDITLYKEGVGVVTLMNARCCLLNDANFHSFAEQTESERGRDYKDLAGRRVFFLKFMSVIGVVNGDEILTDSAMKKAAEFAVKSKDSLIGYGILTKNAKCKTTNEISATVNAVLKSIGFSKSRVKSDGEWVYRLSKPAFLRVISYIDKGRYDELTRTNRKQASVQQKFDYLVSANSLTAYREIHRERAISINIT
ncbi:hypothetical protein JQX08_01385 [Pseudomonas sp. UL073]|uniref:Uncharacterized protein n=1 Tax=Zestomonas insulae TaxID=2809017 RepID=A0ABS2I879_9GAMM|nr:hypothetical protein [Pseudomonas insulae]MBM7059349.1 hypothetical protein [Pseudomonas insulae]